jgi:hypothetical protein
MQAITERDIIEARQRVAAAERKGEQQDFRDALLASPDLTPAMVKEWLDCRVNVHWCACKIDDPTPRIVCEVCGLPPFWTTADPGAREE